MYLQFTKIKVPYDLQLVNFICITYFIIIYVNTKKNISNIHGDYFILV